MEKLEINNEILMLRRELKMARVKIVLRLINQVKKLRQAKGTDEARAKKEQKADRWMQQRKILQKVSLSALARKAMVSEKCWQKVLSEPGATLEERAEARLLGFKPVQQFISAFREKHPEWRSWVPQLVSMWDEKKARQSRAKAPGPTGANATQLGDVKLNEPQVQKHKEKPDHKRKRIGNEDSGSGVESLHDEDEGGDIGSEEDQGGDSSSDDGQGSDNGSDDEGFEKSLPAVAEKLPISVKRKRPVKAAPQGQRAVPSHAPKEPAKVPKPGKALSAVSAKVKGSLVVAPVDMAKLEKDGRELCFQRSSDQEESAGEDSSLVTKGAPKKRDSFFCRGDDDDDDDDGEDEEDAEGGSGDEDEEADQSDEVSPHRSFVQRGRGRTNQGGRHFGGNTDSDRYFNRNDVQGRGSRGFTRGGGRGFTRGGGRGFSREGGRDFPRGGTRGFSRESGRGGRGFSREGGRGGRGFAREGGSDQTGRGSFSREQGDRSRGKGHFGERGNFGGRGGRGASQDRPGHDRMAFEKGDHRGAHRGGAGGGNKTPGESPPCPFPTAT